jgi:hypothetical protein
MINFFLLGENFDLKKDREDSLPNSVLIVFFITGSSSLIPSLNLALRFIMLLKILSKSLLSIFIPGIR